MFACGSRPAVIVPTILVGIVLCALGCRGRGTAPAGAPRVKTPAGRQSASVFSVPPILPAADLPDPRQAPDESLRGAEVRMDVCPGQTALGSLCIYAGDQPLRDVTLRLSDLVGHDGQQAQGTRHSHRKLPAGWKFRPDPSDAGVAGRWFAADLDDSAWAQIRVDIAKGWDTQGFEAERVGYGWYRQTLAPSQEAAESRRRVLWFQAVDEQAWVYLDGKAVFEHTTRSTGLEINDLWTRPFAVDISNHWDGKRAAQVTVRVHNSTQLGGIWMPVHLFASDRKLSDRTMNSVAEDAHTRPDHVEPKRIDSDRIDAYVVNWWYKGEKPARRAELLVKDPELVVADDERKTNTLKYEPKQMRDSPTLLPVSMSAREGAQYFLIARIPMATPAGSYSGVAEFVSGGTVIAKLPVKLRVLPFELEESMLTYAIYYRGGNLNTPKPTPFGAIESEYKTLQQMEADVSDMLDHGIRHVLWYTSTQNILHLRRKFGIRGPVWILQPGAVRPEPEEAPWRRAAADAVRRLRDGGCDPIYIGGPDEPSVDRFAQFRTVCDTTHRLLGVKVFTAVLSPMTWENLRHHLDFPIIYMGRYDGRKEVARWHSDGKPVFTYGLPSGSGDAERFRRYYGLATWKTGADGAAPYAYQHITIENPWNARGLICNFAWPTADGGRIPTVQWEGMRAAITDVRFASTLAKWLFKSAGALGNHPARIAGRRALESLDPEGDLDVQRAVLVNHILALRRAMSEIPE